VSQKQKKKVERGSAAFVERFNDEMNARCIDRPSETVGDLFKAQGTFGPQCDVG
jgi:hypothetical protein